ncbi:MAG: apolipoprotein N-acyltransferase [Spirochaetes bacterium]|nr:apolipoprotein N-acyltransferase [Spirochaetota bacterium]
MVLPFISVLLYVISFPIVYLDFSLWPLMLIALVPFFMELERNHSLLRKFLAGAVWGCIASLCMGYWLFYAMIWQYGTSIITGVIFMIAGLMIPHGFVYGIFAVLYDFMKGTKLSRRFPPVFYVIVVPSLWVVTEFLRELIPLLVPWGFAGYALQPWNLFMQMADITGIYGVSFLVVMINGLMAFLLREIGFRDIKQGALNALNTTWLKNFYRRNRFPLALLALALIIPLCYGAVRRQYVVKSLAAGGGRVPVIIVQPNFTQEERWSGDDFIERVNVCLGLAGRCSAKNGREEVPSAESGDEGVNPAGHRQTGGGEIERNTIVVWPETVLNSEGLVDRKLLAHIFSSTKDARLIAAGGVRRDIDRSGVYNTAYLVSRGDSVMFYDKNILLPFAETAPGGSFIGDFFTAPAEFLKGGTPPAARTDAGTIGLSICFEALYGWHVRRSVSDGARCLINISNDGWFGRSSEPVLHLRQASVRAIETRRYLIRAANNGISAIISPAGKAVVRSGLFTKECLHGEIVLLESKTPYAILGDWIVYAAAALLLGMLIVALVRD